MNVHHMNTEIFKQLDNINADQLEDLKHTLIASHKMHLSILDRINDYIELPYIRRKHWSTVGKDVISFASKCFTELLLNSGNSKEALTYLDELAILREDNPTNLILKIQEVATTLDRLCNEEVVPSDFEEWFKGLFSKRVPKSKWMDEFNALTVQPTDEEIKDLDKPAYLD